MAEWKKVKLGELWKESKIESTNPDSNKRIKVRLNVQGVEKRADKDDQKGATKYFIRKAGQFIYGKQNFHKGAFGIIPRELDNFESSSDIPAFDIVPECNPEWIYYFFKQGGFYKKLENYSKGTGSKRIHPDKIRHLEIPLPSRGEQDRILSNVKLKEVGVSELSNINNLNEDYISKLRQAILQEAVQGKLVLQDPNDEPASELLKKIQKEKESLIKEGKVKKQKPLLPISEDEIPYELPRGWEWIRLGEIIDLVSGQHIMNSDYNLNGLGIPYLTGPADFGRVYPTISKWTDKPKVYSIKKDILITVKGAGLGKLNLVDIDKVAISRQLMAIRPIVAMQEYVYLFLKYHFNYFQQSGVGIAIPGLDRDDINLMRFPVPPLSEQKRIVEKVDKLMTYCNELEKQVKENQVNSEQLMEAVLSESFKK